MKGFDVITRIKYEFLLPALKVYYTILSWARCLVQIDSEETSDVNRHGYF